MSAQAQETTIKIHDLEIINESAIDYFNRTEFGTGAIEPIIIKESAPWTGWNKFWLAGAIGGQAADFVSTGVKLNEGCKEANPIFGEDPSMAVIGLSKAALLGLGYWYTEYLSKGHPNQQARRNLIYGTTAVLGVGAGIHNMSLECR
jgi:hypothetical protein